LSQDGFITGTPKKPGTFSFEITATDANGNAPAKVFTIVIAPAPLVLPNGPANPVPAGTSLTLDFTAKGGIQPYSYTLLCTLPQGLTFNNGVISGTPTRTGSFSCGVVPSDAAGTTVTRDFTLTVTPPALTLSGSKLPDGQVGVVYKTTIAATGGQSPVKYSGAGLPDGLTLAESG